jgi:hypothetical protein
MRGGGAAPNSDEGLSVVQQDLHESYVKSCRRVPFFPVTDIEQLEVVYRRSFIGWLRQRES